MICHCYNTPPKILLLVNTLTYCILTFLCVCLKLHFHNTSPAVQCSYLAKIFSLLLSSLGFYNTSPMPMHIFLTPLYWFIPSHHRTLDHFEYMSPPTHQSTRRGAAASNQAQEDVAVVAMLPPPTKKRGVDNSEQVVAADHFPPKAKKGCWR